MSDTLNSSVQEWETLVGLAHYIVHGGPTESVITEGGPVRSFAKLMADISANSAGIYATSAAGIAATTTGKYFSVPSPEAAEYMILYLNSAGVAVEQKRYPSTFLTAQLQNIAPTGYAWALLDKYGMAAVGVKDDGTWAAKAAEIETLAVVDLIADSFGVMGGDALQAGAPTGFVSAPVDQFGASPGGWKDDGTFAVAALEAQTLNGLPTALLPSFKFKGNYLTDIIHLISYGQSLSIGNGGWFLQTDTVLFDSLMFTAGVRVQEGAGTAAVNHAAFVPLVSALNATTGNGETPAGNAAATIKRLILAENGLAYTDHKYQILVSAPGQSNTAIAGIKKGQTPYSNLLLDVTYGLANAQALGKSYAVPSITMAHGEADYTLASTYAYYLTEFKQLYTDLNTDIKAITNQPDNVKMIAFQCNDVTTTSPATVGLAQLQASKDNPNILIACPTYCLPHLVPGNAHLTGPGYGQLGAYFGLVHKRVVIDGGVWKPVMPTATHRQGFVVTVQFNVPSLPLVLDSALLAAVANSGFTLVDNVGAAIAITSVTVTGPATVKIIAGAAVPAGSKLRYGYLAGGGNLRDSQGDTLSAGVKTNIPLHNWCVAFEEILA